MKLTAKFFAVLIFFVFPAAVFSQDTPSSAVLKEEVSKRSEIEILREVVSFQENALVELNLAFEKLKIEQQNGLFDAQKRYYQSEIEFYNYQESLRQQNISTLNWQLISAYVVLILVVGVTVLGGRLSYMEVKKAIEIGRIHEHKLDATAQRIQLTSTVTGVLILVISLAFLFLFVREVFHLNPTTLVEGQSLVSGPNENRQ